MNITKKIVSGILWMSSISYLGYALSFLIQLILVRLLNPEDFGIFFLGLSIAEILFIFFSYSFPLAVIQIQEAEDLFDTAFYLTLLSGVVLVSLSSLSTVLLKSYYSLHTILVFFILCVNQAIQSCASLYSASMEKTLNFKKNAIIRGVVSGTAGIASVIMAYFSFGVWSLVGRELLMSVLLYIGMKNYSDYRFSKRFSLKTAKLLLVFNYKFLLSRGLEIVYHRIPNLFIGTLTGVKTLGFFTQAYYLANLPNTIFGAATQNVSYVVYSKIQNNREKITNIFYITNYFLIRLLIPIMIILAIFPDFVIKILYGNKWIDASSYLRYFSIYAALLPLFSNAKTLAYGLGKLREVIYTYIFEILILFLSIFYICYETAENGIIVSSFYSVSITGGLSLILHLLKREGIQLFCKEILVTPVAVSIITSVIWYSPLNHIFDGKVGNTLSYLVIMLVAYMLLLISMIALEPKRTLENLRFILEKLR